jgi:hypothetical protein
MKQGYYKLSIKRDIKPADGLSVMEQIGACVMLVATIWGGLLLMGMIR